MRGYDDDGDDVKTLSVTMMKNEEEWSSAAVSDVTVEVTRL